jgi:hypothetical protein
MLRRLRWDKKPQIEAGCGEIEVMASYYHDVMTAITVRLAELDHKLLQLACLMTKKSQNLLITELIQAEIDRLLPGKRRTAAADRDPDGLWKALGIPVPAPTELDNRAVDELFESLRDEGDGAQERRAA